MAIFCMPNIVRDMNIKVFNLLARINETRKIVWHETCKCVCRFTSANGMKINADVNVKKIWLVN